MNGLDSKVIMKRKYGALVVKGYSNLTYSFHKPFHILQQVENYLHFPDNPQRRNIYIPLNGYYNKIVVHNDHMDLALSATDKYLYQHQKEQHLKFIIYWVSYKLSKFKFADNTLRFFFISLTKA